MTCGIYMIKNKVNGKMYIGQAVDIKRRWRCHKERLRGNQNRPNKHLQSDWNEYGEDNFEFSILLECDESQLDIMEVDYISKLKTYDPDFGYNKTYGGVGGRFIEEAKREMSDAKKGIIFSKEHKKNISEALKGKYCGKNHPNYGKHHSEETRKKISKAKSKPIVQIDPSTNKVVNVWGSGMAAERIGGFNNCTINDCCKGRRKSHGGYKWQYLHDYISQIDPRIKKIMLFGKEYTF